MSFDSIKEEMSKKTGQFVLYRWEIKKIIDNLGGRCSQDTIKNKLKYGRLVPLEYDINSTSHGIFGSVVLYSQKKVWNYLKELEYNGKIKLKEKGITCFEQILEKEYHKISLGHGGSKGKSIKKKIQFDGTGGSWDNAVKAYEE